MMTRCYELAIKRFAFGVANEPHKGPSAGGNKIKWQDFRVLSFFMRALFSLCVDIGVDLHPGWGCRFDYFIGRAVRAMCARQVPGAH